MPILGIYASAISGNLAFPSYESIATVTVGSGGSSSVTLSSIPSTYTHLQLRCFGQTNRATVPFDSLFVTLNSDTNNGNYYRHGFNGTGSSTYSYGSGTDARAQFSWNFGTTAGSNWGIGIVDIFDYTNTNKFKTMRSLGGSDVNGTVNGFGGEVGIGSNLYQSTSAITSITLTPYVGTLINQYSSFALYGIKG